MPTHIVEADPAVEALSMVEKPPDACVNWERCENRVPHNAMMCAECLDRVRHNDSPAH